MLQSPIPNVAFRTKIVSTHVSCLFPVPTFELTIYFISAALHGKPSSSAIIFHGGNPLLMADVGAGVLKPCREKLG